MGDNCDCRGQITVAAWGRPTGTEWSFIAQSAGISEIIIRHGEIIDSIKFKRSRDSDYSTRFGGKGGDRTDTIKLNYPSEFLTGVSGSYGQTQHGKNNIRGITFFTNRSEYGPFGNGSGHPFSFHAKDCMITGFHGRAGRFLDAIGVYIVPVCSLSTEVEKNAVTLGSSRMLSRCHSPPRSAAAFGGSGGRDWDDGVFSAVKGAHVRLLNHTLAAVRFIYENVDGSDFVSPFRGVSCTAEMQRKTMLFVDKYEFLIGIEGFYGPLEKLGVNVIRSITFVSNKAKYGPFGAEIGTFFTSGDFNRQVVGFHGRCGAYLDAIGLHTNGGFRGGLKLKIISS